MNRKGIAAGGNWILDKIKVIDDYPPQDGLCNILQESKSNGGAPYNVLINISKLEVDIELLGIGLVGDDLDGLFILKDCNKQGINTTEIAKTEKGSTSYTNVMTSKKTGRRTFFHHRGANALLDLEHFDVNKLDCKIFHLGYLLLLDKFDDIGETGKTKAAILLQKIRSKGIETSIDIVSENGGKFQTIVPCSLPHVDYLFVNEYEASMITAIPLAENKNGFDLNKLIEIAKKLIKLGVNKFVFLHFPDGVIAVNHLNIVWKQGSVNLPKKLIRGTSGAGDALAAGVLYGLHQDYEISKILKFGVSMAACSLLDVTSSGGIKPLPQVNALGEKYNFIKI